MLQSRYKDSILALLTVVILLFSTNSALASVQDAEGDRVKNQELADSIENYMNFRALLKFKWVGIVTCVD